LNNQANLEEISDDVKKKTNWNTGAIKYWNIGQNRLTTAFGFNGIDIFSMIGLSPGL
jgi:hypothetical protein